MFFASIWDELWEKMRVNLWYKRIQTRVLDLSVSAWISSWIFDCVCLCTSEDGAFTPKKKKRPALSHPMYEQADKSPNESTKKLRPTPRRQGAGGSHNHQSDVHHWGGKKRPVTKKPGRKILTTGLLGRRGSANSACLTSSLCLQQKMQALNPVVVKKKSGKERFFQPLFTEIVCQWSNPYTIDFWEKMMGSGGVPRLGGGKRDLTPSLYIREWDSFSKSFSP